MKTKWFQIHGEKIVYSVDDIGAHLLGKKSKKGKLDACLIL